ncbi:tyrosine-type recombinase/integrase [Nocardioides alkalitolerans]|uniref:tyrosine-type recombinase/integrase n=1 Tax=Nocardioides alkalitolerans TaxID=281714 RepID=UPI0004088FEA|nr:site-specific integrase [Nocardioides alkalitolerans]
MAWSERLASGRYRGLYRDNAGKQRSADGTFSHAARARAAAAKEEEKVRRRLISNPDAHRQTWGEWCDTWWEVRDVAASTRKVDASRLDLYLKPKWRDVPVGAINRHAIKLWVAELRRSGLTPATIERIVALMSASLTAAIDAEIIDVNPTARMRLSVPSQGAERFLSRTEYSLVLGNLPTTDDQLVADLLVYTGLRWGELAGLHVHRTDLDRGMFSVIEAYDEKNGLIKAYPKGKRRREVPLTDDLVTRLSALEHDRGPCGVPHEHGQTCRGPLLVTSPRGGVLRNSNWSDVWKSAVVASEIGHTRIHDLRHTYASWLLQAGYSLAKVGQLLGHVSSATTQRYAHLENTNRDDVLGALGAPVIPAKPKKRPEAAALGVVGGA